MIPPSTVLTRELRNLKGLAAWIKREAGFDERALEGPLQPTAAGVLAAEHQEPRSPIGRAEIQAKESS